jgi:hypothetical protein
MGLPPIKIIKRQFVIRSFDIWVIIDIFARHTDGSASVIEVKCTNEKNPRTSVFEQTQAIGQLLLYRAIVKERIGAYPRLFLFDTKIYPRTYAIFSEMKLPITLVEIQDNRVFIPLINY